jgi:hypothetical protein
MSTGRTFSTSSSQREVSQAHGQIGSNHMSAVTRSVTTAPLVGSIMDSHSLPILARAVGIMNLP